MCGILGIVGEPVAQARLARMAQTMAHRGPDAAGYLHWHNGAFAHRRLSILDTRAAANQPFVDSAGRAILVFNGEIYNYRELRRILEGHGYVFRTTSDTEVLLLGYLHWGEDVVEKLNGMFAFAIWDVQQRQLLLARDRLGKKPLYIARLPEGGLLFASELKPLLASGLIDSAIDPEALVDYLHLNYILCPKTPLRQVRQLPAAHVGVWRDGLWQTRAYWDHAAAFLQGRQPAGEPVDALAELLEDATRMRLYSDVPLGAFLSGGVDSSTITALMRRAGVDDLHTFSIEFPSPDFNEGKFARLAADHVGTSHHPRLVDDAGLADVMPDFARLLDTPLGDDSAIACYFLSRWARRRVTVALSGDGADELFAGYVTYQADALHRRLRPLRWPLALVLSLIRPLVPERGAKLSRRFRLDQFRRGLLRPTADAHFTWRQVSDPVTYLDRLAPDVRQAALSYSPLNVFRELFDRVGGADWLDRLLYVDCQTWLRDNILVKVDRTSMAASLECRAPFLDYRVVELAARLPRRCKLRGRHKKVVLRDLARRLLPAEIVDRKKSGFNSPTADWLRGPLRAWAQDLLAGGALDGLGLSWSPHVASLWQAFQHGARQHQYVLWGLISLGLWERHVRQQFDAIGRTEPASLPEAVERRKSA